MKGCNIMENKIKFSINVVRWFDRINGNTYHSCRITVIKDSSTIFCPMVYGYSECYKQTSLEALLINNLLPKNYSKENNNLYLYERENNYPILWNVSEGLKRECITNGKE